MHSKKMLYPIRATYNARCNKRGEVYIQKKLHSIQCYEVKLKTFCYEQVVDKRIELLLPD